MGKTANVETEPEAPVVEETEPEAPVVEETEPEAPFLEESKHSKLKHVTPLNAPVHEGPSDGEKIPIQACLVDISVY